MRENLFEMGADLGDGWQADNKSKSSTPNTTETKPPQKHLLTLTKEKRRGKVVTIVKPFYLEKHALKALLKELKHQLGTGGTIKDNTIELQGDVTPTLRPLLLSKKFKLK